ncbi:uncharacterized protein LOC124904304 isoform X6 [Homo sapiens]|uniref:uncharacterized protein LOC124904304 isoform X6 n=1 Tax=Homo sapiens TaxID=9606 RepID=UPI001FB0ED00|nr:uncharacterized protein LOC124904304 isoform X6 [Homo sapiens]
MLNTRELFISYCSRSSPRSNCKNSKNCNLRHKWIKGKARQLHRLANIIGLLQSRPSQAKVFEGSPQRKEDPFIIWIHPWPSVMVKATDVRCQPLASCLTVEGYSTDWTEMPCPETRNLESQLGKKGYQRLKST